MCKQTQQVHSQASDHTRLRFTPAHNRVDLILEPEWASVLHPTMNDRIEVGLSDRLSGPLAVFIDQRWQGRYRWKRYGKRGALLIALFYKAAFDWCRGLLPERFEYVPTEFELLRGHSGIRGFTVNWPSWGEVVIANASSQGDREILQQRLEKMRFPPQLVAEAFMDGERIVF